MNDYHVFNIREAFIEAKKGISLLKCISKYVSRKILDMTYKLYIRPHLDYGDVIYHNQRVDLMHLVEQTPYKAALVVSGCWQGTSREKLYKNFGWESLSDRWFHRLTLFYTISNGHKPSYLANQVPNKEENSFNLRRPKRTHIYALQ